MNKYRATGQYYAAPVPPEHEQGENNHPYMVVDPEGNEHGRHKYDRQAIATAAAMNAASVDPEPDDGP